MDERRCAYCGKKLSSRRRADAKYCPTSRCRVGGYRERVLSGTFSTATYAPYAVRAQSRGQRVIARWQQEGREIEMDPWCQARAEALAYEIMEEHCKQLRREARDRVWKEASPSGRREKTVGPWERIHLEARVRCVGLAIIPAECGGGAVLVTGTEQDSRYRRR